ncbi:MAG: MerR family transcriptional regulator [Armatimonadetes bacterium]|nr:MerR family transcriptional regulator [Armatimonadota bacterium]
MPEKSRDEPVYYIGVAARLVGVHPQTLRSYERLGFVRPYRTQRGQRLYSEADLDRVRQVRRLIEELGVNLAGVEVILNLLDRIEKLQAEVEALKRRIEHGLPALGPGSSEEIQTQRAGATE